MNQKKNPRAVKLVNKIQTDPVYFVSEAFGSTLWNKQIEVITSVMNNRRTTVRSCHGAGKSFISALTTLWFLYTKAKSKVITTAPTFRQVEDILWREIRNNMSRKKWPLEGTVNKTSIDRSEESFAMGLSTDQPDRFQGFHAENILLIVDEAAGVTEDIFQASEGIISSEGARLLLIGNPTNLSGTFYNSFKAPTFHKISVSAFDTPNLTEFGITLDDIRNNTWREKITGPLPRPYLITPEWVYDKFLRWGESSPMWQSRVIGDFPTEGTDDLIPLSKVEQAIHRELAYKPDDPECIGVDVARFGDDWTVFTYRKGPKVIDVRKYHHDDTMVTAQHLFMYATDKPNAMITIDVVGVGGGVYDRACQLLKGRNIIPVNVGEKAYDSERFINLRAELSFGLRDRFITGDIQIPNDEELMNQLSSIKFKFTDRGQFKIESKEDMKERGMGSPDESDSLMLAFFTGKNISFTTLDKPVSIAMATKVTYNQLSDEERKKQELMADIKLMHSNAQR